MKQGKIFNRIVEVALLRAILAYFIIPFFPRSTIHDHHPNHRLGRAPAMYTSGCVVRQEQVLSVAIRHHPFDPGRGRPSRNRSGSGGGLSKTNLLRPGKVRSPRWKSRCISSRPPRRTKPTRRPWRLWTRRLSRAQSLAIYTSRRDMTALEQVGTDLKTLVLQRTADKKDLHSIQAQISDIEALTLQPEVRPGRTQSVLAPSSGYFFRYGRRI